MESYSCLTGAISEPRWPEDGAFGCWLVEQIPAAVLTFGDRRSHTCRRYWRVALTDRSDRVGKPILMNDPHRGDDVIMRHHEPSDGSAVDRGTTTRTTTRDPTMRCVAPFRQTASWSCRISRWPSLPEPRSPAGRPDGYRRPGCRFVPDRRVSGPAPNPNGRAPHTQCSPMDLVRLLSAMVPTFHAVEVDLLATRLIAASSAGRLAIILVVTAWLAP